MLTVWYKTQDTGPSPLSLHFVFSPSPKRFSPRSPESNSPLSLVTFLPSGGLWSEAKRSPLTHMLKLSCKRLTALVQTSLGNHSLILQTSSPSGLQGLQLFICWSSMPLQFSRHTSALCLISPPAVRPSSPASIQRQHGSWQRREKGGPFWRILLSSVM